MGGVYTIYTYFNATEIQGVLNAVVMLMGSTGVDGNYLSIVRVAAILGLFMAIAYGFVKARGEEAGHYLVMMAIFYSCLFTPRVTVTIEDHGVGAGAPIVVDNVPLGLAFFASTTSHIGFWLTEQTETFFSLPDTSLRLGQSGLMGGARALREAQSASLQDPVLAEDMINFMRDCINPELVTAPANVPLLLQSTNIWTDLGPAGLGLINPGRMATLAGLPTALPCDLVYGVIDTRLAPSATSEFARIARMLHPGATALNAQTILGSMLPASEGLIMTASASTFDSIKQRMMINVLNDTSSSIAQITNDPAAAQVAVGHAMAASSANSSYLVMAKLAQETLPMVHNAIELVIIGVFPIVLLLIIIAGSKGGQVLRSYVMTMLWVQLWAPLYAIVNYVGTMASAKSMRAALAGVDGISVHNAASLLTSAISAEAIAGMLTVSVPMIALAIVKGGETAMTGITSGLTGPADRAAAKTGEQVGTGNISLGNTQWANHTGYNTSANKSNTDLSVLSGAGTVRDQNGNESTWFQSGRSVANNPVHRGALGATQGATASSGISQMAASKMESATTNAVAAGQAAQAAVQQLVGTGADRRVENRVGSGISHTQQGKDAVSSTIATNNGQTAQFGQGQDATVAAAATVKGGFGVGRDAKTEVPNGSPAPQSAVQPPVAAQSVPAPVLGQAPATDAAIQPGVAVAPVQGAPAGQAPASGQPAPTGAKPAAGAPRSGRSSRFSANAELMEQARSEFKKSRALNDVAGMNQATQKMLDYAEAYQKEQSQGTTTSGGNSARKDVAATLSRARTHLDESRAALSESKAFTEAAQVAKGSESGASYSPLNPANQSAAEYTKQEAGISSTPGNQRGKALEGVRHGIAGEPEMSKQHMSGDTVEDKDGLRKDHAQNRQAPGVADTTAATHRTNAAGVAPGATGTGAVPLSKKAELKNEASRQSIKSQAEADHYDGKKTAAAAADHTLKENGQVGNSPTDEKAMRPQTTKDQAPTVVTNLATNMAMGPVKDLLETGPVQTVLKSAGYEVEQSERPHNPGGGWTPQPPPNQKK